MIGKIIPTLAIACLLLVSVGTIASTPTQGDTWVLIIAPTHEGGNVYENAYDMYDYFKDSGISDEKIILLTDGSSESYVDGDATEEDIEDAFEYLEENVEINDEVIIVLGDDGVCGGGVNKFITTSNEQVSEYDFADMVDDISCSRMVIVLSFDYSGGFVNDLTAPGRLILTSHSVSESTETNEYNLADGLTDIGADLNMDGQVSFEEAHTYVSNGIEDQTPQIDDRIIGEYIL